MGGQLDGIPIYNPFKVKELKFDYIILATASGIDEMERQLLSYGVHGLKIRKPEQFSIMIRARETFLARYAQLVHESDLHGSVAEAGVFRGEFAKHINVHFAGRKLYLFDTFSGFDQKDLYYETYAEEKGHLAATSVSLVMSKMKNPKDVIIKQGWFPESAKGIDDEFIFVSLDMDLYKPTLEGIVFFYPLLVQGGVILLHDYYSENYTGVKNAVAEAERNMGINFCKIPIGDDLSIAIIKT